MKEIVFENISEIEDKIKKDVPLLYKYRDWNCSNHRKIITDNQIWLSHPKTLNDDMDIRVPLKFSYEEIYDPLFFEKLKKYALDNNWFPNLLSNSRDFNIACENKLDIIKQNPVQYFNNSFNMVYNSDTYDCIGILSLTSNPHNRPMWAHYANNSQGFCIGFDTIELFKNIMPISFYKVDYVSEAMEWSFIKAEEEKITEWFYIKHVDWINEAEYRFITPEIINNERIRNFNKTVIKEILVGANISDKNLNEIIEVLKTNYSNNIPLYKIVRDNSSYKIKRQQLK